MISNFVILYPSITVQASVCDGMSEIVFSDTLVAFDMPILVFICLKTKKYETFIKSFQISMLLIGKRHTS